MRSRWRRCRRPTGTAGYFAATVAMWMVMMVGMMLPSAAPTRAAVRCAAEARRSAGRRQPGATALFAAGYVLAWGAFSVLATTAQWGLSERDAAFGDDDRQEPGFRRDRC